MAPWVMTQPVMTAEGGHRFKKLETLGPDSKPPLMIRLALPGDANVISRRLNRSVLIGISPSMSGRTPRRQVPQWAMQGGQRCYLNAAIRPKRESAEGIGW